MEKIQLVEDLIAWVEKISSRKYYPFLLVLTLTCSSLFLAFPRYDQYTATASNWDTVMLKANDLSNNLTHLDPNTWLAKKVFRLTVPAIIKSFHLNRPMVIAIQFVIGLLLLYFSYLLVKRLLNDAVSATFFTTGLVFIYIGRTCFTEISATWFDGWAYFFLLIALFNPNVISVFFFATLAAWVDERAIVIMPAILIYYQARNMMSGNFLIDLNGLFNFRGESIALLAAFIFTVSLRFILNVYVGMATPLVNVNLDVVKDNLFTYGFGVFTFFEGFWLLLALVIYYALKNKNYLLLLVIVGQMALSTFGAMFVYDVTRSGSYMFPILFIWIFYLGKYIPQFSMRSVLLVCTFFCFIFSPINYVSHWSLEFGTEKPIIYVLLKLLAGT